jgi:hypothetical protein
MCYFAVRELLLLPISSSSWLIVAPARPQLHVQTGFAPVSLVWLLDSISCFRAADAVAFGFPEDSQGSRWLL